jgi:RNA polymerase sigma-70 factor (ECF subfamily)
MALAEHAGPERGLEAIGAIENVERLRAYPFYPAALGELELRVGRTENAKGYFLAARQLARNESERVYLEQRIRECEPRQAPSTCDV